MPRRGNQGNTMRRHIQAAALQIEQRVLPPDTGAKMTNMSSGCGRPSPRSGLCCRICVRRAVWRKQRRR